jgi:hypothetical protein
LGLPRVLFWRRKFPAPRKAFPASKHMSAQKRVKIGFNVFAIDGLPQRKANTSQYNLNRGEFPYGI